MNTKKDILEIFNNFWISKHKSLKIKNEKDILEFFKKCQMENFTSKPLVNKGFQSIKNLLIINYNWTGIEELFDDINEIILEILESDSKDLGVELIFKILNFETKFIDFLSCFNI